jgi:hypothetical protein
MIIIKKLGGMVPDRFELVEPQYTFTSKFNIGDKVLYEKGVYEICAVAKDNFNVWYRFVEELNLNDIWRQEWAVELYVEPKVLEITIEQLEKEKGCKVKIIK